MPLRQISSGYWSPEWPARHLALRGEQMRLTAARSDASSLFAGGLVVALGCSGAGNTLTGDAGAVTASTTGQSCTAASQCYALVADSGAVQGTITCLTQGITSGYCTHTCASDADCCAAPGECPTGFAEVCAPFESTGQTYCFLSCTSAAISAAPDAGTADATTYCQLYANGSFTCRSTGGGRSNQQFCGP